MQNSAISRWRVAIESDVALLLFKKWRDESAPLRVLAYLPDGYFAMDCHVIHCSRSSITLKPSGEQDVFELVLHECEFEYGEPVRNEERDEILAGHRCSADLIAKRPGRLRLLFMVIESGGRGQAKI